MCVCVCAKDLKSYEEWLHSLPITLHLMLRKIQLRFVRQGWRLEDLQPGCHWAWKLLQYSRHNVGRSWIRMAVWGWRRQAKSKRFLEGKVIEASESLQEPKWPWSFYQGRYWWKPNRIWEWVEKTSQEEWVRRRGMVRFEFWWWRFSSWWSSRWDTP